MATTYALVGSGILADLDLKLKEIPSANRGNIDLITSSVSGNSVAADYIYNAGSSKDVIRFGLRKNYDTKNDRTNCSLRISSAIRQTVSETGEVTDLPIEAVIAWNYSGKTCADTAHMSWLLQAAASLVFKDLAGANGLPTTVTIDAFDRGVLTQLY